MKPLVQILTGAMFLGLAYMLLRPDVGDERRISADISTITVRSERGPIEFYLDEIGVIRARRSVTLASELPSSRAKIVRLVPEGSFVRKGEIIVEFDPTPFEEDVAVLEKEYDEAQGALAQVEQEFQLEIENAKITREARKHEVRMAEIKLYRMKTIEIPLRIAQARQKLRETRIRLMGAKQRLEDLRDLQRKGYGKRRELQAAEREVESLYAEVSHLEKRYRLLKDKSGPAEIRVAELELEALRRKVAHDERIARHKIALKNASLIRARTRLEQLADRLKKARGLLEKTVIRAPVSGFVLLRRVAVQGESRKVQIGDSVWFRNGFATLPDMSSLMIELAVRESDLGRLEEGQPVEIRPSAWPDLLLTGRVASIGTLSQTEGGVQEPRFRVQIDLDRTDPRLRPGMTALVRIRTARFEDVVSVPVDAVLHRRDETFCLVETPLGVREVPVITGPTDGARVVIRQGLKGGERLWLLPPGDTVP